MAWPGRKHTVLNIENTKKKKVYVCVYVCASEPVPNESFTGSSTSGHLSTQEKTGSVCLCLCMFNCVSMHREAEIYNNRLFLAFIFACFAQNVDDYLLSRLGISLLQIS